MSQPQKKPNFLSQMLPFAVIYLAIVLFFKGTQGPAEVRTADQILTVMRDQNAKELDQSILENKRALEGRLAGDVKAKLLTEAEADQKKLEGVLLTADAQLRAGNHRADINRTEASYQTLQAEWKSRHDKPIWTETTFNLPLGATTPEGLYEKSRAALNAANQKDLLYGFIPAYDLINKLVNSTGAVPGISYALAALVLAIIVRAIIYPLSQKQLLWGRQMAQLAPLVREIKDKYKDPQEQGIKTMDLYKEYGINPYAGCLPALIQLPLFLTVYKCMLHYRFQFISGTFLWINPSTSAALRGLGFFQPAANLGLEDHFLIIIYGITMVTSTLLTPVSDPSNMRQQRLLGVGMSLMFVGMMFFGFFPVPAAFVLYWTFTNILATAQSLRAYRMPLQPLVKVNVPTGGVYPVKKRNSFTDMMREAMEQKMMEGKKGEPEAAKPDKNADIQPYKAPSNGKSKSTKPTNGKPSGGSSSNKPKKRN